MALIADTAYTVGATLFKYVGNKLCGGKCFNDVKSKIDDSDSIRGDEERGAFAIDLSCPR